MAENTFITNSAEETQRIAAELGKTLSAGDVVLLYGDLGSGKTTFVQSVAKSLGVQQRIISPTFIVVRVYDVEKGDIKKFYHVDLYRVTAKEDLEGFGIHEILNDKDAIVAIEWAEKLDPRLLHNAKKLYFEQLGEEKRKITINE